MKVLIVDDNREAAITLCMLVELLGYEARSAYDGIQALDIAAQYCPDVVLLDLGMPRMDGYEVCRRLRASPSGKKLRLVAVTGWGGQADRLNTRSAGFDEHLVKPVAPEIIARMLAAFAAERKAD